MEREPSVYMFPIVKEGGFAVRDVETYKHLMEVIYIATTELMEEYPEKQVFVVYELEDDEK